MIILLQLGDIPIKTVLNICPNLFGKEENRPEQNSFLAIEEFKLVSQSASTSDRLKRKKSITNSTNIVERNVKWVGDILFTSIHAFLFVVSVIRLVLRRRRPK